MKKPTYQNHLALYTWAALYVYNHDVVDIGCGEGYGMQILSVFAKSVRGLDISPTFINKARNKQYHCPASFEMVDLDEGPVISASLIVGLEVLEHIKRPRAFLEHIQGTPFIFSLPHNDHHPLHLTYYHSVEEVAELFNGMAVDIFKYSHGVVSAASGPSSEGPIPQRYVVASKGLVSL